jgi:hypothetical protein
MVELILHAACLPGILVAMWMVDRTGRRQKNAMLFFGSLQIVLVLVFMRRVFEVWSLMSHSPQDYPVVRAALTLVITWSMVWVGWMLHQGRAELRK